MVSGAGWSAVAVWGCMGLLCLYNGNAWALLAIPSLRLGHFDVAIPRLGRVFYGYYVAHLAALSLGATLLS